MKAKLIMSLLLITLCWATFTGCAFGDANTKGNNIDNNTRQEKEKDSKKKDNDKDKDKDGNVQENSGDDDLAPSGDDYDYAEIYGDVLNQYYATLYMAVPMDEVSDGFIYLNEALNYNDSAADLIYQVGYTITDLSGDGVPELVIGSISAANNGENTGDNIYAVYTCVDGAPYLTFEGWTRNQYYYVNGGSFYNEGSSGAMSSSFGMFVLSEDGTELECISFYFTAESDDDPTVEAYYHNDNGTIEKGISEEVSEDTYNEELMTFEYATGEIELTSFDSYNYTGEALTIIDEKEMEFEALWVKDCKERINEYKMIDEYVTVDAAPDCGVIFFPEHELPKFTVYSLEFVDASDDGKIIFDITELYTPIQVSPECPLILDISCIENIPSYGISFEDEDGDTRYYAIGMSGEDGSVVMIEFDPE